ncbi:MAG: hypothetical protein HUU21_41005 [Polyangiaceae bacterium]|nr:hypothetical protein [Polyangiaceae bacterium]
MTDELQARKDEALEALFTLGRVMSFMAALAAPRFLARLSTDEREKLSSKQALLLLDEYLKTVEACKSGEFQDADGDLRRTEESTRAVRALLQEWHFLNDAPAPLVDAAQAYFKAFGTPEPEGGWDYWDGSDDSE